MEDYEIVLAFLCSERQRLESYLRCCEDLVKQYSDELTFNRYLRAKYQYQYFLEIEKSLDKLLHLYS